MNAFISGPAFSAEQVEDLLAAGDIGRALGLVREAAARNDAEALFRLAAWTLVGQHLPRDLPRARQLLRRATLRGSGAAGSLEVALTANGTGGRRDWPAALQLLRNVARNNAAARADLELLEAMELDSSGMPKRLPDPRRISVEPDVRLWPGLLSQAECEHLARVSADLLRPSLVADPRTGRMIDHPVRRSDAAVIGPAREDLVVAAINRRLAAISGTQLANGEPLTVLRYGPGQEYRSHFDILPGEANQRVATVLVYLNEGYEGGATRFDAVGLEVVGKAGDALMFRNTLGDGRTDPLSRHAGAPVTNGHKWLATRWIRARPFDVWRRDGELT